MSESGPGHCVTEETKKHGIGNGKKKRRVGQTKNGKGGSCRQLTGCDQNSEADQVDMKFVSNKSPLPPSSHASILFTPGALIIFPCSSCQHLLSHLCQSQLSISLKATSGSLHYCLFLLPISLPVLFLRASITHPLCPPLGPSLPLPQLTKGGLNEGVHVNLWWPLIRSFNQGSKSCGLNDMEYNESQQENSFNQGQMFEGDYRF